MPPADTTAVSMLGTSDPFSSLGNSGGRRSESQRSAAPEVHAIKSRTRTAPLPEKEGPPFDTDPGSVNGAVKDLGSQPNKEEEEEEVHHEVPATMFLTPPEIYSHVASAGGQKFKNPFFSELPLCVLAGIYIGMGFSLCMLCAGQLSAELRADQPGLYNFFFGAFGFPFGLSLCVVAGASLFTSNVLYMSTAFWEGKAKWYHVLYIWVFSWFANLCGGLILAGLMIAGEVFTDRADFTKHLVEHKVSYTFGVAVVKGLFCNWLVCLAVWQANGANDLSGKFIAIWLPISAFVAMGFEHCIANQFVLPLGYMLGADITIEQIIVNNLIPVTIGNLIGGGFCVGTVYSLAYGKPGKAINRVASTGWRWVKCKVGFRND